LLRIVHFPQKKEEKLPTLRPHSLTDAYGTGRQKGKRKKRGGEKRKRKGRTPHPFQALWEKKGRRETSGAVYCENSAIVAKKSETRGGRKGGGERNEIDKSLFMGTLTKKKEGMEGHLIHE